MAKAQAVATEEKAAQRRFVSEGSRGLQLMEVAKEHRDPKTRDVVGYERECDGKIVQRHELRVVKFSPMSVMWPPKATRYARRLMGCYVTSDPFEINLIEKHIQAGGTVIEYPLEWETEVVKDPLSKEDKKSIQVEE
jgi:hypothetical protein